MDNLKNESNNVILWRFVAWH